MKKVINGEDLKIKMKNAIDLLCNTVKTTLGPKGNNIIIDHSDFTPFITNDGVTIAKNIESDDVVINTILELAKEATIRTNENVGDGTTTTLVLLQSIFDEGLKAIDKGVSPIILKRELDELLKEIVLRIESKSRKPKNSELLNIAQVSANGKEIGEIVFEVYSKIKDRNSITIKEGIDKTVVNYLKGYTFDTIIASEYFFSEEKEITLMLLEQLEQRNIRRLLPALKEFLKNPDKERIFKTIIIESLANQNVNEKFEVVDKDGSFVVVPSECVPVMELNSIHKVMDIIEKELGNQDVSFLQYCGEVLMGYIGNIYPNDIVANQYSLIACAIIFYVDSLLSSNISSSLALEEKFNINDEEINKMIEKLEKMTFL